MDSGQLPNTGHNDGCHRLYKAARLGREHLSSLVLTTEETLAIRHDAVLGPPRPPGAAARREQGEPVMITITISLADLAVSGLTVTLQRTGINLLRCG